MADYIVETHILKAYLFDCLLKVIVVEHLESIAIDEEHRVSLDLSMAGLN